jgi:hypothetical protein
LIKVASESVSVTVLIAGKGVPAINHMKWFVNVVGAVSHPLARADRVQVYGVGVRKSTRLTGYFLVSG